MRHLQIIRQIIRDGLIGWPLRYSRLGLFQSTRHRATRRSCRARLRRPPRCCRTIASLREGQRLVRVHCGRKRLASVGRIGRYTPCASVTPILVTCLNGGQQLWKGGEVYEYAPVALSLSVVAATLCPPGLGRRFVYVIRAEKESPIPAFFSCSRYEARDIGCYPHPTRSPLRGLWPRQNISEPHPNQPKTHANGAENQRDKRIAGYDRQNYRPSDHKDRKTPTNPVETGSQDVSQESSRSGEYPTVRSYAVLALREREVLLCR